ncbi:MAG: ShlB/FhaC/HecB family hemolysin secretion/activation protein, partial [Microcoleaceae cyanobacterium]
MSISTKVDASPVIEMSSLSPLPSGNEVRGDSVIPTMMRPITGPVTSRLRTFSLQSEGLINSLLPSISSSHLPPNEGFSLSPRTPLLAQNPSTPLLNPQSDPNGDRFLQPTPQPTPQLPQKEPPPLTPTPTPNPTPTPSPSPEFPSTPIPIQKIEVLGSTILKPEEIEKLTRPFEGRSVTLQELRELAEKITEIYLERGYITSRAILPPQTMRGGLVKIQIIEGKLATIQIEGNKHLKASYLSSRIRLGASVPLNPSKLEDQLRLLRLDPLLENVEASLRAGEKEGESILIVRIVEANRFGSSFSLDNYSPPSVGSERAGLYLRYRNLTGFGDEFSGTYYKAIGDSDVLDFNYRIPVNAMNGTLQLRVAPNRNGIVLAPFDEFGISGK